LTNTEAEAADWLLTPEAVRIQCRALFEHALVGSLPHFDVQMNRLNDAADLVCQVIRDNYPTLEVPAHARWRHFVIEGDDRWVPFSLSLAVDAMERARIECELAITSVLLDAGAGPDWRYKDAKSGRHLKRSEGLAIASLDLYLGGVFSSIHDHQMRADEAGLESFSSRDLEAGFQVSDDNPLEGLEGRAALIARLVTCLTNVPAVFGNSDPRLGNIADYLMTHVVDGKLEARTILITILHALGRIWPGRPEMAGRNLGDTWAHPLAPESGLVPFHKLSQWLSYSLFEPMQKLGVEIVGQDALTGLAEYRNGGLFLDTGVLSLKDPAQASTPQEPGSELVVEWRALTVCLLDEVASLVREKLGKAETEMPLASILEGGTWAAGRRIAGQLRKNSTPPIAIVSDGSVF
jgi:hypothetical protein